MFGFLKKLIAPGNAPPASPAPPAGNLTVDELCRRLGVAEQQLRSLELVYRTFQIAKRRGGTRTIAAPADELKKIQRLILHRLLRRLKAHPAATGFERGYSIVSNALPHVGQEMVIKLDVQDFFGSTPASRVEKYFGTIGWNAEASALLTRLCTHESALPQGAPTSPRLSNLLNHRLDARLAALAKKRGLAYSRYADDMTFSGLAGAPDKGGRCTDIVHAAKEIVREEGYALHTKKKLRIARRHDRQIVTGLVVNEKVSLPRAKRRWLRAVAHHLQTARPATLTPQQLAGWQSLAAMIVAQSSS